MEVITRVGVILYVGVGRFWSGCAYDGSTKLLKIIIRANNISYFITFNSSSKYQLMNYVDMFVVVLLAWAIFKGATRGLVMQASTLAALVLGIYAALKFSGFTAKQIAEHFSVNAENLYLISLALTFIGVFILIHLIGKLIDKLLEVIQLSMINKVLGVIFSLCKMALIIGIILAFLDRLNSRAPFFPEGTKEKSIFFEPLSSLAKEIFPGLEFYEPSAEDPNDVYVLFLE